MAGLEGKTLDHYELQRLIGKGGMADVYEAYDRYFQREVAVKVFKREDDELLRRFIREAKLMASLKNEHLVPIYGSGECQLDGLIQYYIIMPFMQGGTLRTRIRHAPLTLAQACECLQEIAPAIDYIHSQGVVHRDIKASNVLLDADGRYYLSDFGIARMTADVTQLTSTGNVLGTVDYIAPELFEGNNKADALSDLYSLGVLLFEMVTGRLPFHADNQIAVVTMHISKPPPLPRSLNPHISPQVEHVILKALQKKPERRYQSAIELANAFCIAIAASDLEETQEDVLDSAPVAPEPRTTPERITPLIVQPPPTPTPAGAINRAPTPEMPPTPTINRGATLPKVSSSSSPIYRGEPLGSRPIERTQKQRRRRASPTSQRAVVVAILALVILLVLAVPTFLVATHRLNPNNAFATTPVQTATTPDLTASAQTDASATAQAQDQATAQAQYQATAQAQDQATATAQAQGQATATAQAVASATAQAQDQATATVVAGVTATAQAQAQATAGVDQTATAGTPIYQDALTDPTNSNTMAANWDQNSHCMFMSDGYHVTKSVGIVNLHGCRESANTYSNLAISVDVRILSGHSGGVFFRVSTDVFNTYTGGYLFEIDSQGDYRISGFNGSVQPLHDWASSSALKKGNAVTNTLLVVAQGGKLLFYANGMFLAEVDDTTYTSGVIAFLASTTDTNADVVYTNLRVYQLS